jgi:hypothetical protein
MTVTTHPRALEAFRKLEGQAFQYGARRYSPLSTKAGFVLLCCGFALGSSVTILILSMGAGR